MEFYIAQYADKGLIGTILIERVEMYKLFRKRKFRHEYNAYQEVIDLIKEED